MRIGIIGLGSIGRRHFENARALGHDVWAYDPVLPDDHRSSRCLISPEALVERSDAIVVASPSDLHEEGLRLCVEAGKHCLVEKPLGTAIGRFPELLAQAKEDNLVVMMGNNLRFHPAAPHIGTRRKWANFICATKTDKPTYRSDGVVLCTGAHEVDIALECFGPARLVSACGIGEETADFVLHHDANGTRSSFHIDFETDSEVRQVWLGGDIYSTCIDWRNRTITSTNDGGALYTKFKLGGSYDDDYKNEMREFTALCEGSSIGDERPATGDDGLATLKLLLEIRQRIAFPYEAFRA